MYLERISLILDIVGQHTNVSVSEVCIASGLPKPTVYRLMRDLASNGLVEATSQGNYRIGSRLETIARGASLVRPVEEIILPALKQAAELHGVSFFMSRLIGVSVEITHVETPQTGVSYLHPGLGKRPVHACSCAKAIAAFLPDNRLSLTLEDGLKAYTDKTITTIDDLRSDFEAIRTRGYAECVEEIEHGMCSIAAPLGQEGFDAMIAIGAAASTRVFTQTARPKMGAIIKSLNEQLSSTINMDTVEKLPKVV